MHRAAVGGVGVGDDDARACPGVLDELALEALAVLCGHDDALYGIVGHGERR